MACTEDQVAHFETTVREAAKAQNLDIESLIDSNFPMDKHDLNRFLASRSGNEKTACEALLATLKWRSTTKPATITEEELTALLSSGEAFFGPLDLQNNDVVYVPVELHTNWGTPEIDASYQKLCLFLMETGIRRARDRGSPSGRATMVIYLGKFGMSNMDLNFTQFLTNCFANYYPETLSHILLIDAPWIFSTCWPVIKGWIDPNTAKKIAFISTGELTQYISPANMPVEYGGSWVWKYERLTPGPK